MRKTQKSRPLSFFAMLLALLGIGGCEITDIIDNGGGAMVMYGSPTVLYEVKGKVTDQKGNPIPGIQVTVESEFKGDGCLVYYSAIEEAVTTGSNGKWQRYASHMPTQTLKISYKDIDGEAGGGEFADDSIFVNVTIVKDEKKAQQNFWYLGDAKVDVPTVKLKKK